MDITIRIGNADSVTISAQCAMPGGSGPDAIPEVIKASIAHSELPNITKDQLLAVAGQAIDYLTTLDSPFANIPETKAGSFWDDKAREAFRRGEPIDQ